MRLFPKVARNFERIDPTVVPPRLLIAGLVQLSMMSAAERHGEFIARLETNGPGLCKPQVMRVRGVPSTDEARLGGNKFKVCLVSQPLGLGERELALVDLVRVFRRCGRGQRWCQEVFPGLFEVSAHELSHRSAVTASIIMRRSRDRRRVVRV